MNTLGDALQKALKKNDYSKFIWKAEKRKDGDKYVQDSKLMIDMTQEELQECYDKCVSMLYNSDYKNLGRYNVLAEVNSQINKCNVELFLRYCENTYKRTERKATPRNLFRLSLREFIENANEQRKQEGKEIVEDWSKIPISVAASYLPEEFENISISDVMDGCIDYLGAFDKQHLTMTFITKMGLWFTKAEETELPAQSNTERLKIAKDRLHLPEKLVLRFSERGLSYKEMRAMLTLPKKQKYSDMTTDQLVTLKNKVLPRYQTEVDNHIFSWRRLQKQVLLVAKDKGFKLTLYNDLN